MIDRAELSLARLKEMAQAKTPLSSPPAEKSFADTMKGYINEVNDMQVQADRDVRSAIAGDDIDAHQVMLSVEKANISFDLVMEIRNRLLDVYREVMKSSV